MRLIMPSSARRTALPLVAVSLLLAATTAEAASSITASCTGITYYGYCRIEANCTTDGSAADRSGAPLQHTFLDMGQCIGYDGQTGALQWRTRTVPHWQSAYCEPCNQCTIDPASTVMTCQCRYRDAQANHATTLTLSDHLSNNGGVLQCMTAHGDPDPSA